MNSQELFCLKIHSYTKSVGPIPIYTDYLLVNLEVFGIDSATQNQPIKEGRIKMTSQFKQTFLAALSFLFIMTFSQASMATENPFGMSNDLNAQTQVADNDKGDAKCGGDKKGKCGEGKCGGDKAKKEGKCGEGKCGGDKAKKEGKCGEGKCGGDKAKMKGKCGEGKCGGDKKSEKKGKCGEGKCGGN